MTSADASTDHDLSADARSYIQSLRMPSDREAAREYARMDEQSFRARVGPGLDALNAQLLVLVRAQQDTLKAQIDTRDELRNSRNLPVSRKMLAGFAVCGGAFAEVLLNMGSAVLHNLGMLKP